MGFAAWLRVDSARLRQQYFERAAKRPGERFDAKRRLVRLLYERNWSRKRIPDFFAVLDWMMRP